MRYTVGAIAALITAVSAAFWLGVGAPKSPPAVTLGILTSLGQDELRVFSEVVGRFEPAHHLDIQIQNFTWQHVISQLESRSDIDLIIFDMNGWRQKLVREELIEDLSVYKGLVPQSVHPALVSYLQGKGGRYFLPFRPNVRLVFLKRKGFEDLDPERFQNLDREHPYLPRTWADVMTYAKRFYERDGEARIVIEATDADAPLFLLELIRTARGDPLNLQDPSVQGGDRVSCTDFGRTCPQNLDTSTGRRRWATC